MSVLATDREVTKEKMNIVEKKPEEKKTSDPLVLLFGWAGASNKNLGKYAELYTKAGCTTVQYTLPTNFIFNITAEVPDLMSTYIEKVAETQRLSQRPILIHCMSDTGLMCYQGLTIAEEKKRKEGEHHSLLDIKGVVFDSCCGPYPEITLRDVSKFLLVNFYCCIKDQIGVQATLRSSWRFLMDRGWPNYIGKLMGLPVELSKMNVFGVETLERSTAATSLLDRSYSCSLSVTSTFPTSLWSRKCYP